MLTKWKTEMRAVVVLTVVVGAVTDFNLQCCRRTYQQIARALGPAPEDIWLRYKRLGDVSIGFGMTLSKNCETNPKINYKNQHDFY